MAFRNQKMYMGLIKIQTEDFEVKYSYLELIYIKKMEEIG